MNTIKPMHAFAVIALISLWGAATCLGQEHSGRASQPARSSEVASSSLGLLLPDIVEPTFAPEVPGEVRKVVAELLAAYSRGDAEEVCSYLVTDLEPARLKVAYSTVQLPIMDTRISGNGKSSILVAYEIPHPAAIISAVLRGGADLHEVQKGVGELRGDPDDRYSRAETWKLVHTPAGPRIAYDGKGLLGFAASLGNDIDSYAHDPETRRFLDDSILGGVPNRVAFLAATVCTAYDITTESQESDALVERVLLKLMAEEEQTKEVSTASFSLRIPLFWEQLEVGDGAEDDRLCYAGKAGNGDGVCFLGVALEADFSDRFQGRTDDDLLVAVSALDKEHLAGMASEDGGKVEIAEAGFTKLAGAPAKFVAATVTPTDGEAKRLIRYLAVRNAKVYSLTIGVPAASFSEQTLTSVLRIKDSFVIKTRY